VSAYFGRGNAYFAQENFQQAVNDYTHAIELNPDLPYAYVARGYAYANLDETELALSDLRRFVNRVGEGADPEAEQLIAQLEGQMVAQAPTPGARAGVISLAPLLVSPTPGPSAAEIVGAGDQTPAADAAFYFNQGVAQAQDGDYPQAIESLTRATDLDPNLADAYYFRGYLYTLQDDLEQALDDYSRVIELAPGFPDIYRDRGSIYYFQGDIDRALDDFHEYTRLAGNEVDTQTADFIAQLEADQALLATAEPSTAEQYYERGEANRRLRDFEAAIADYTQALELDPAYTDALIARAAAYYALEDFEAAIADYTRAIERDPNNPPLYLSRGSAYHELGDEANTARDFYQWLLLNEQRPIDHDAVTPGEPFTVQMQEGYVYRIPFEADAGQVVTVTANDADESGVDPLVVIVNEGGEALVGDDDGGGDYDSLVEDFAIPQGGTYTLVVGHAGGGSVGAVEVMIELNDG
jgi:tetratricopeptide (TPR) repeat protein